MKRHLAYAAVAAALLLSAPFARAQDPALLTFSGGVFDLVGHRTQEFEARAEYRFGYGAFSSDGGTFRGFHPFVGFMGNTAEAFFGYAGLAAPFAFDDDKYEFVPSAGMGAYREGHGVFVGGTFEFHLGLAASYAISRNNRLGIAVDHISNAGTHAKNPGINSLLVTYSIALDGP